jgi:hypothetical protein
MEVDFTLPLVLVLENYFNKFHLSIDMMSYVIVDRRNQ